MITKNVNFSLIIYLINLYNFLYLYTIHMYETATLFHQKLRGFKNSIETMNSIFRLST